MTDIAQHSDTDSAPFALLSTANSDGLCHLSDEDTAMVDRAMATIAAARVRGDDPFAGRAG